MALSVKSWGSAHTDLVCMRNVHMEFVGKDDPALTSWFDGKDFSEWPVFPCWGMYFRNIGQVKLKNVTLQLKGKDYRKPIIYDNVHKKPSTSACNIITKTAK